MRQRSRIARQLSTRGSTVTPYAPQIHVGRRESGVTVAYVTHDPTRGEPAITCWFCAEEIEVFETVHAMPATDPKSRLWRHVATLDQHCDQPAPTAQPFDDLEAQRRIGRP